MLILEDFLKHWPTILCLFMVIIGNRFAYATVVNPPYVIRDNYSSFWCQVIISVSLLVSFAAAPVFFVLIFCPQQPSMAYIVFFATLEGIVEGNCYGYAQIRAKESG